MNSISKTLYILPFVLILQSCGGDSNNDAMTLAPIETPQDDAEDDPSLPSVLEHSVDIQPIWDINCTESCHSPGGVWSSLRLDSQMAHTALLSGTSQQSPLVFVDPGSAENSYVWHKINGTHRDAPAFGSGSTMPLNLTGEEETRLSSSDLETIRQWIDGGALP